MTNIIRKLTEGCIGDCAISNKGGSITDIHWEPVYDKTGKQINSLDPNIHTEYYECSYCGLCWIVKNQQGKEPVITRRK